MIEIDGDELYVLDGVEVYVYSLQDYGFLRNSVKKAKDRGNFSPA